MEEIPILFKYTWFAVVPIQTLQLLQTACEGEVSANHSAGDKIQQLLKRVNFIFIHTTALFEFPSLINNKIRS